ncbi:MAG: TRAP transporter large permease subunit [Desulfobacterales bacterium]|nr:MAG: TRAP transporter large permease subunit [Desulfobacterales bacterium]
MSITYLKKTSRTVETGQEDVRTTIQSMLDELEAGGNKIVRRFARDFEKGRATFSSLRKNWRWAIIAGGIPGLLIGAFLMVCGHLLSKKHGYNGDGRKATFGEILKALKDAIFALMVPLIVLGGFTAGSRRRPKPALSPLSIPLLPKALSCERFPGKRSDRSCGVPC